MLIELTSLCLCLLSAEIKILLPLNLSDRHHLLFKFYHISCKNAKAVAAATADTTTVNVNLTATATATAAAAAAAAAAATTTTTTFASSDVNDVFKSVELAIGYAWLPICRNGRLLNGGGERQLSVAQNLPAGYLALEKSGQAAADIKWVDGMRPLFKVALDFQSTVATSDLHLANFYAQTDIVTKCAVAKPPPPHPHPLLYNPSKERAPVAVSQHMEKIVEAETPGDVSTTNVSAIKLVRLKLATKNVFYYDYTNRTNRHDRRWPWRACSSRSKRSSR